MNSKILTNEYKVDLEDGITLYYGSQDETTSKVISITVKGKFKPIDDLKDYSENIKKTKELFQRHGNQIITNIDWIEKHYIFTTDFTECGITKDKSCKWKFQIYVSPKNVDRLESYKAHIVKISETMVECLEYYFDTNGFEISK